MPKLIYLRALRFSILVLISVALFSWACSDQQESRVSAAVDSVSALAGPRPGAAAAAAPSGADASHQARVIYVEASEGEIEAARTQLSEEDFAVTADDLMFYRSSALEMLEQWHIPFTRLTGRRPLEFTVDGVPVTVGFEDITTLDFIVVYRPDERPRVFAPNEIAGVRAYWQSGSAASDTPN